MTLDTRMRYWTKKRHHTDTLEVQVIHLRVSMDGLPLWHHQPQPDLHLEHLYMQNFEYISSISFFSFNQQGNGELLVGAGKTSHGHMCFYGLNCKLVKQNKLSCAC